MRVLPALALAAALLAGACTNPDGSVNVPGTVALGAGAALAGLAIASASERPRRRDDYRHWHGHGYQSGHGRHGYSSGYGRPYRGW